MDRWWRIEWLALAATAVLAVGVHGTPIPLAAWIGPALLLRVTRDARLWRGWLVAAAAYAVAATIAFSGAYLPFDPGPLAALAILFGLVRSAPHALDRALGSRRVSPSVRLLAFPVAATALELGIARIAPFGTWGITAYAARDSLVLQQLAALAGVSGVGFLIHCFAPAANALWEGRGDLRRAGRPALLYGVLLLAAWGFGELRLALAPTAQGTVAVAAVVPPVKVYEAAFRGLRVGDLVAAGQAARAEEASARFAPLVDDLFARSEAAAAAGAQLVAWPESTPVLAEDEARLLQRAAELARRRGIELLVTPWVIHRGGEFPFVDNTSQLVRPSGEVAFRYSKAHPVLFVETGRIAAGPGRLAVAETGLGRLGSAICQDLDFPWLIRQASREKVQLLVAPADDWRAITGTHAAMARLRAIENGVALLRPASNGLSIAVDPWGRLVGTVDAFATGDGPLLLTRLPVERVSTLYGWLGDWFGALCGLGALWLVGTLLRRPRLDGS